ncbi:MAG: hypothetical protein MI976_11695 [Pseudomonadales bacterium]|nr:hypothetical protein [Pseudomonadales bacterium]
MIPRILESICLMLLWVSTLLAVITLVGIVIAVIPLGWTPLFFYSCVGLVFAWLFYKRTVKPDAKPVSNALAIQCGFLFLMAVTAAALGFTESFAFGMPAAHVAALPVMFFPIMFVRRAMFAIEDIRGTVETGVVARFFLVIAYIWLAITLAYIAVSMAGTLVTDFFAGVSMLISPLNPVSWLVIFAWFLPFFILRAVGRAMKTVRPY